ncbi:hypothetical protein LP419_06305 [Massilia sp. H-1]|nr:hypothetical protein LP419_06305 [Massilia sp. H-1]
MSDTNTITEPGTLRGLIAAQDGVPFGTDDVLLLVLPLFEHVAALHAQGMVAALGPNSVILDPADKRARLAPPRKASRAHSTSMPSTGCSRCPHRD